MTRRGLAAVVIEGARHQVRTLQRQVGTESLGCTDGFGWDVGRPPRQVRLRTLERRSRPAARSRRPRTVIEAARAPIAQLEGAPRPRLPAAAPTHATPPAVPSRTATRPRLPIHARAIARTRSPRGSRPGTRGAHIHALAQRIRTRGSWMLDLLRGDWLPEHVSRRRFQAFCRRRVYEVSASPTGRCRAKIRSGRLHLRR